MSERIKREIKKGLKKKRLIKNNKRLRGFKQYEY